MDGLLQARPEKIQWKLRLIYLNTEKNARYCANIRSFEQVANGKRNYGRNVAIH